MHARYFFSSAVFALGAVAFVIPKGYSLGFYLLSFAGLGLWLKYRGNIFPPDTRYFYLPILAYAFVNIALSLHEKWAGREPANYLPFVLVMFGVWVIRHYKTKAEWFWVGLAVGAIGAAVLSGYQAIVLGVRAGGHTNPIQFGNVALLFGVLCLVRTLVGYQGRAMKVLMLAGFAAGIAASVWSQTRGGWLAVILILIWIMVKTTSAWAPLKRATVSIGIFIVLAIPALQPNGVVQTRINVAKNELSAFYEQGKEDTSVGARLAMWSLAIDGISNAPIFGHGNQGWIQTRDAAIQNGRLSKFSSNFTHVHSEYFDVVFKRGLLGLVVYLALCLVPMLMFFKPNLQNARPDVRALAMAGMVIPMMYMDFGLTQTFLSHNSGRIVLCSLWMCVAGLMLNAAEDN